MARIDTPPTSQKPVAIGEHTFFLRPAQDQGPLSLDARDPSLIIIFGWLGAQMPHLLKYTQGYSALYPGATQLIVRCPGSSFFWPASWKRALMTPVVETLNAHGYTSASHDSANPRRVIIHAFSNGGAYSLASLSTFLPKTPSPSPLPCAVILDSAPGVITLPTALAAFTGQIRALIPRALAIVFFTFVYAAARLNTIIFGAEPSILFVRRVLGVPAFLPWTDTRTPRLYVYSKSDDLVPHAAVKAHADQIEALGAPVLSEMYEKSAHVAHMRSDPQRYWKAVKQVWEFVKI